MKITILDKCTVTTGDVSLDEITRLGDVTEYDVVSDVAAAIGDSDAVIINKAQITDDVMEKCKNLKYVGIFATGYNNVDIASAKRRGIVVANVPGYSTDSVAQTAFTMILHFATNADLYDATVKAGDWANSATFSYLRFPITELAGKTLGIFGFGTIGKRIARIADAFGMRIIAVSHHPQVYDGVEFVDAETLFTESDYLSLNCPLTPETRGIVNKNTLAKMKKTAVLINTARGGCVVEEDLANALNSGVIAGAGVDVLDTEPMKKGHPYLTAKNMFMTPHIAWASYEARKRLITIVADNLSSFMRGEPKNNVAKQE